jgi:hypothetical protein
MMAQSSRSERSSNRSARVSVSVALAFVIEGGTGDSVGVLALALGLMGLSMGGGEVGREGEVGKGGAVMLISAGFRCWELIVGRE